MAAATIQINLRVPAATDTELDDQVRLVFVMAGQTDPIAISKVTGIKLALVERILEGWRIAGGKTHSNRKGKTP